MIFEEALKLMREGKKIRLSFFDKNDGYFEACHESWPIFGIYEQRIGIVRMKDGKIHEDMNGKFILQPGNCPNPILHSYAHIPLRYIMDDRWEVAE